MSWKTLLINSEIKFSIKNGFLNLFNFTSEIQRRVPLDDIDIVIIENTKSVLTIPTINEFADRNITLIIADSKHDPNAFLLPISTHHKPLQNFNFQLQQIPRVKNVLHRQIIKSKIDNQRLVLEDLGVDENVLDKMKILSKDVNQGDKTNREAVSARLFFREIYGSSFVRFNDDGINSFINFGYKILASKISNSIIKYGLNPSIGIFHRSQLNYFNLSYDFIEPLRPIVDWLANYLSMEINKELTIVLKLKILRILDMKVFIDGKSHRIRNAIDLMIKSYVSFLKGEKSTLLLPKIFLKEIKDQIDEHEFKEFLLY